MRVIVKLMKGEARALVVWAAVIVAALIWFWVSQGTGNHQLAIGLLLSAVALFVLMALFEIVWRVFDDRAT